MPNLQIHNSSINQGYNDLLMNCKKKKKKSHIYSIYKEMVINLSLNKEYLKRYYNINESNIRIPKFQQYYKHYLKYLTKPNISFFLF